jgi:spore coat polysaccharide biosynthesis predicted glycosyltransferase SpsG
MKRKISILIRTSGGLAPKKQLGFGHIYRSVNLADQLKPNKIHFLLEDFGGAKAIIRARGYKTTSLKKGISLKNDILNTLDVIKKNRIDILVIDRYKLKNQYVRAMYKVVKTIVISDLRTIDFPAHLVINGFIGFTNHITYNKFGTKCVLGPKYQILNKNFQKKITSPKTVTLLATFGGFDENNITDKLLDAVEPFLNSIKLKIILGPATRHNKKIIAFKNKYKDNLTIIQKTDSMHKEIAQTKFGICSGGITSYEFARYNVPFAIVSQVRHQLITSKQWQKRNQAYNLGLASSSTKNKIGIFISEIMKNKIRTKNLRLIDGLGAKRVADEILELA